MVVCRTVRIRSHLGLLGHYVRNDIVRPGKNDGDRVAEQSSSDHESNEFWWQIESRNHDIRGLYDGERNDAVNDRHADHLASLELRKEPAQIVFWNSQIGAPMFFYFTFPGCETCG